MGARVTKLCRGECLPVRASECMRWKWVASRESKSGLVSILGYGGMSDKLESATRSMLYGGKGCGNNSL